MYPVKDIGFFIVRCVTCLALIMGFVVIMPALKKQHDTLVNEQSTVAPTAEQTVSEEPQPVEQVEQKQVKKHLTRQEIADIVNKVHVNTEATINRSAAQIEANQLAVTIQNLQLQEQQLNAQGSAYSGYSSGMAQVQADMSHPHSTGMDIGYQQTYSILVAAQQVQNQIQYYQQALSSDLAKINEYRNTTYTNAKNSCAASQDIAPADISYCQSLYTWNF